MKVRTIEALRQELQAKESQLKKLQVQRKKLVNELAKIDETIAGLTGTGQPSRRKKKATKAKAKKAGKKIVRRRAKPLAEYTRQILAEYPKGMRIRDLADAVKKAGYKTVSKNFYYNVSQLVRTDDRFKRVSKGVYKLAG